MATNAGRRLADYIGTRHVSSSLGAASSQTLGSGARSRPSSRHGLDFDSQPLRHKTVEVFATGRARARSCAHRRLHTHDRRRSLGGSQMRVIVVREEQAFSG
jgi:hypothetical protein